LVSTLAARLREKSAHRRHLLVAELAEQRGGLVVLLVARDKARMETRPWLAMVLARLVDDERLSKEILKETRAALPLNATAPIP
jgi:hypothetical protein